MELGSVLAYLKIVVPQARPIDINVHRENILGELNALGIERTIYVDVVLPTSLEGDILDRVADTDYNYYPSIGALVLPTEIVKVEYVYFGTTPLKKTTADRQLSENMPPNSYFYAGGVMYFSAALQTGDVIKIHGRVGALNFDLLPDYYSEYIKFFIAEGLYTLQYPDDKKAKYYGKLAEKARPVIFRKGQGYTSPQASPILKRS